MGSVVAGVPTALAAFALVIGLTACGGDDAPAEDAVATETTSTTQDDDREASETTEEATTTAVPAEVDLPIIDPASLDPCSLIDKADADALLGEPTTQSTTNHPSPEVPEGRPGCAFTIHPSDITEGLVTVVVSPLAAEGEVAELRSRLDDACDLEDATTFGPSAFRASACNGPQYPPGFTGLFVPVDGGTIELIVIHEGATTESLDEIMTTALDRAG